MRLHQLIPAAAPYDAVTGQALAWQAFLERAGVRGDVFAEHIAPEMSGRVRPLRQLRPADPSARVLLRYSIWSRTAEAALEVPPERLGIVYHNITPAEFLRPINPAVAELCERGRVELARFADRVAVCIADSTFNGVELTQLGFPQPAVVPLLLDLPTPPAPQDSLPERVLTVGRIVPNKRLEDVIRAVALLRSAHRPDAHLTIIGTADGFESYRDALVTFGDRLGIADGVDFRGRVSDAERDAAYANSGCYLAMSEHEGFCAPLLEAAARGLTVIARDAGAVPETLGAGGILIPGDPAVAAEAVAEVLANPVLRSQLRDGAASRIADLAAPIVEAQALRALEPLLR